MPPAVGFRLVVNGLHFGEEGNHRQVRVSSGRAAAMRRLAVTHNAERTRALVCMDDLETCRFADDAELDMRFEFAVEA